MAFQKIIYDILILKRSELVPAALVHYANGQMDGPNGQMT